MVMTTVTMLPGNICASTLESIGNHGNFPTFYNLKMHGGQGGLAINSQYNKIYVADSDSHRLIVIDGNSGNITYIPVGKGESPEAIVSSTDDIYVLDSISRDLDRVTIIDGDTNNIETDFPVIKAQAIAVNPEDNTIYVAPKSDADNVKPYSLPLTGPGGYSGGSPIPSGGHPVSIAVNSNTYKIYTVNSNNDTVSAINSTTYNRTDISVGSRGGYPNAIAVDTKTSKIYVTIYNYASVSVIDGTTDKREPDIPVGINPSYIAVNPNTNKIYVANKDSVSVIDGNTDTRVADIYLEKTPDAIAVNPNDNTIYLANYEQGGSVTVIDGNTNKVAAGVTFKTDPADSGQIICKKVETPTNQYLYIELGTQCTALANKGFEFNRWVENSGLNSITTISRFSDSPLNSFLSAFGMKPNDTSATFGINRFGTFTADFRALPPPIPPEYVATLFTVVATAFIGTWLTPALIGWSKTRTQRKHFKECINQIGKSDKNTIEDKIIGYYADGKLSDIHHQLLKDKISEYYEDRHSERYGAPIT